MKRDRSLRIVQLVTLRATSLVAVRQVLAIFTCLIALVTLGKAEPILFTFTGTGTGSAGATTFTNIPFTLRLAADTANVFRTPQTLYSLDGAYSTIELTGVGSGSFQVGTRFWVDQSIKFLGFSLATVFGPDRLITYHPSFSAYDLQTSFGPVTALGSDSRQFLDMPSSLGSISLIAVSDVTFTAELGSPPHVSILRLSTNQARIGWTTNATGYSLEYTTSLSSPAWTTLANTQTVIGDQFTLIVDSVVGQSFYRLRKPEREDDANALTGCVLGSMPASVARDR